MKKKINTIKELFEDGGTTLMDRILGNAKTPITQASIQAIHLKVLECLSEENALGAVGDEVAGVGGSLTVATHVFDTLQTDAWNTEEDVSGYNFQYAAPAACFPNGGKWYGLWFRFTPTTGEPFWVVWVGLAQNVPEMS